MIFNEIKIKVLKEENQSFYQQMERNGRKKTLKMALY